MELLELWKKHLERTRSERTTITYVNAVKSFLKRVSTDNPLEVSSKELYQYADLSELSAASLLTHFSAIRHFYKFLTRRGFLPKDSFSEIEEAIEDIKEDYGLHTLYRKPKALEKSQLERIFQKVKGSKYENIYRLFLYSGIRLSEYKSLRPEHFFLDKSGIYWIHLPAEITKRKKERMAPLIGPSREETYRFTEGLSRFLENYEDTLSVNAASLQVYTNRLSKKLGFHFSLHSFRHTYITNLINQGFPAELVKEFAGHANIKTTIDIYYRFSPERAKAVVENFLKG
ncbi:site-specific integrase [Thermocrinis sp.]|uniref:tyrosine-type recombinase/integrase n=1 Tax=Thermocrinis sp. TaxID=2024383 RepID=UPI002FDD092A